MVHGFQKQFQMQDICNFFVTNYLFVVSKEIISRKQIFQVFNTCYYVRRIFIFYPQPIRSVLYPKGIHELFSQYKRFAFSLKHFLVLAQVVVNKYWKGGCHVNSNPFSSRFFAITKLYCIFLFWKFDNYTFRPLAWWPVTMLNIRGTNFIIQFSKNIPGCILQIFFVGFIRDITNL